MSVEPEVKRRSGYDPHQPRDRKGRWVETGAEVRNSITHAIGTVDRILRGDAFHENRYEVSTRDGGKQVWETSAVDVIRNPDGSAPSVHNPVDRGHAAARTPSALSGAIGHVYAGQAPAAPGNRPAVGHAIDAVYGSRARSTERPNVSAAINSIYGGPQAPAAPNGPQAPAAPGVRNLPGRNYVAKPPRGVDPKRFEEVQAPQRAQLGLDNRWIVGGDGHGYTPVMALKPGDQVYTHTDGTEVHLPKVPSNTTLPRYGRTPRTVDWVEQQGMGFYVVHFTDGTSSTPDKSNFRAFAVMPKDRVDATPGGTPSAGEQITAADVKRGDFVTVNVDGQDHTGVAIGAADIGGRRRLVLVDPATAGAAPDGVAVSADTPVTRHPTPAPDSVQNEQVRNTLAMAERDRNRPPAPGPDGGTPPAPTPPTPDPTPPPPVNPPDGGTPATPIRWTREQGGAGYNPSDAAESGVDPYLFRTASSATQPWVLQTNYGDEDFLTQREAQARYAELRAEQARLGYWPPMHGEQALADVRPGDSIDLNPIAGISERNAGGPVIAVDQTPVDIPGAQGQYIGVTFRAYNGATWKGYVPADRPVVTTRAGRSRIDRNRLDMTEPPRDAQGNTIVQADDGNGNGDLRRRLTGEPMPDQTPPPPPARTAPEVPDGPLTDPTRNALTAIAGTNGVSDQDLAYYGQRFVDLPAGTLTADEAHARVDDARNSIINTADSGDRAGAMLALDNLDMAIDAQGGPDPLAGFGTPREFTQNDRFSPPRGAWVDIPAAGRRPAVTGIVEYGGRTNASGTRIHVRQDDGSTVERQVKPGETYRVRATPDSVESSARYRVGGMSDADLAAEVERVSDPQTGAAARELADLLDRREQVQSGADAAPPRQAEVTPLWERADDAMLAAADRAKTPEDAATLRAASTAFKTSLEEAGYDAPSTEARTLPTRLAGMSDAEVLALNERASRYDGGFPDDAIDFLHADLLHRGYTEDGVPNAGSRVGMTNPQHPSDALVGQRVAFREEISSDESAWTVGTLTPADAQGNHWLENGDGSGVNSGVRVGPDQYVEPVRPDDPRVDRLDPTEMTAPELDAAIARQQARTTELARTSGVNSPEFRDANSTLQDMARERDSRPDDPFAPVDPGGTGALFGDGADAPEAPAGETVNASALNIGDTISYTTADGIQITGEIEGMHTAGPRIVTTLRMPDDSRETRAFAHDAPVLRTSSVTDAPTEDVPARDMEVGDRFLTPDASGAYRPATVVSRRRDTGGTGLVFEVARDGGDHETVYVDPSEVLPRVAANVPPEPDLPPIPDDPQPDEGTKFARGLVAGDRIASYGDVITVLRSRTSPDGQTVTAHVRLPNGAEDDVTFGADAVLPLADPPNAVTVEPHPAGTATLRPTLYTYQRKGIVALGLDEAGSNQPALVQQAAARVRNRQALSEEQNAALADALRAQAAQPGVRAPRQRALQRQAASFDAAAAALGGRVPPVTPNRDTVEKTRPGNLVEGDWIALRGQGAAGGVDVVQVLGKRVMMGGRLHELTVRDQEDNVSTRLVAGNADTYLLPDLPRDLPAPPESEKPRAEHVSADRIAVGDTIRFKFYNEDTYQTEDREGVVRTAAVDAQRADYRIFNVDVVGGVPNGQVGQREVGVKNTASVDGGGTVVRTARGPASQDQPYDSLLPTETPEVLRSSRDVGYGDRVTIPGRFGLPVEGVVHGIDHVEGEDGSKGVRLQIRRDDGQITGVAVFDGDGTITRLAKGDDGAEQQIKAMYAEREKQAHAKMIGRYFDGFRRDIASYEVVGVRSSDTPEQAAAYVENIRDEGTVRGARTMRDTAESIARGLAPDGDAAAASAIQQRVVPILDQLRAEMLTSIAESFRQVPPDQTGQNPANFMWPNDVLRQWKENPPSRDHRAISRTLVDAAANLTIDASGEPGTPTVNVPEGADLRTRIAAYKAALPGGEAFGKQRVNRTVFKNASLDDLEAGRVPETETTVAYVPDRAADGGPGHTAMAHHDVLLAAGRDIDAEIQRRIVARDASLGKDPEGTLSTLQAEKKQAQEAASVASNAYWALQGDYGDPAYMDVRAQARAAMDSAYERSKEVTARYQALNMKLARLRREVAMEILADHREIGGVQLGWVDNKGKLLTDRSKLVKAMRSAEKVYPKEWLQRFKDRTNGKFLLKSSKRGHFMEGREITLSDKAIKYEGGGPQDDVAVHELGHGMEWVVPGLVAAEEAFLWSRTSAGPVGSRVREKQATIYKGTTERGYKDEFPEHYTGKDYGGKFYEVFTTSVESVFAGSDYADENMRHWTLGSMVLL